MPLCTGAEGDGETYFGVALTFRAPAAVVGVVVLELLVELLVELLLELLDDPQPAASTSAEQANSVDRPLFIAACTLA